MSDRGLRRADWRFLLPAPPSGRFNKLVLLGGDNEQAELLVKAGIALHVTCRLESPGTADAVVLLRRAKVSPVDAARMLQDDKGVFYAEVDRLQSTRRWLTPRTMERQLHEAGLSVTGVYLVLPRFETGRRYVPMDHPGLLEWYFGTLHSAGTPMSLVALAGLRLAAGPKHRRLSSVAAWYGVTAVSGSPTMPPSVLGHPKLPDSLRPPDVRTLMLTNGQDDGSRVVILPFAPGGREPLGVVKVSRAAAFNGNTVREQEALSAIRQGLDDKLRHSIPEPLGLVQYAGLSVAVESCARGAALSASTGRLGRGFSEVLKDLQLSVAWLAEFQRQTRTGPASWTSEDAAHLEARLEQYAEAFRVPDRIRELLRATGTQSKALVGAVLPKVCLHNDLGPWNVYRDGGHITVIDWELGEGSTGRTGPALCDLIYFVTYWTLRARRLWSEAAKLHGFRNLFLGPSPGDRASAGARAAIRDYFGLSGIDPRFLPPLLVYTWVERTLDQLSRAGTAEQPAVSASIDQYSQFIHLLSEQREQLFSTPLR